MSVSPCPVRQAHRRDDSNINVEVVPPLLKQRGYTADVGLVGAFLLAIEVRHQFGLDALQQRAAVVIGQLGLAGSACHLTGARANAWCLLIKAEASLSMGL
jgi:hypothetical protein